MKKKLTSIVTMALAIMLCLSLYHTEAFAKSKPVKLSKSTATVTVGKTTTLKAKYNGKSVKANKVKWTSSKKAVATVSSKGKVKAKKAGSTVIKATYRKNGKKYTAQCKVTVTAKKSTVAECPTGKHKWKTVIDREYEVEIGTPILELRLANHWYMTNGMDVTDWQYIRDDGTLDRTKIGEWEAQHCPRGCGGIVAPDPICCYHDKICYGADTYVVVGYKDLRNVPQMDCHNECTVCGKKTEVYQYYYY